MKPRQSLFGVTTVAVAFLVASQASAQPAVATLFNDDGTGTLLSDNSAELLINRDGSVSANGTPTITVGDILVAIVGINTIGPTTIGAGTSPTYNEVTAMTITKIAAASDVDLGPAGPDDSFGVQNIDLWQFTAVPLDGGDVACVNWAAGTIDTTCSGGAEYTFPVLPGASNDGMLISAIFEDAGNNYDRDHGIQTGVTSATDGSLRLLVAIDPAKGDFLSVIAPLDLGGFGAVPPSTAIDNSNISLDGTITYQNWPGLALDENITAGNGGVSSPIAGSDWPVFDNLDFTLTSAPQCCVDIEKEIMVDGVWYDHDDCADAPVVQAPHDGEYRLIVTNCGNTTLTSVKINDPTLGITDVPIADLAPGETRTLTSGDIAALGSQTICMSAGEFPNTASITGDCAEGPVPSVSDEDSSCLVCEEQEQCRVTAGGNKDGLTIPCELKSNGTPDPTTCADKGPDTWGGQAGAPPRTDGNWTHHHHPNNKDTFVFHSNDLYDITCSDPGPWCEPSNAPSPDRQIDFSGIGRFTNKHGAYASLPDGDLCFRVHLEDLGEPGPGGRRNDIDPTSCSHCPGTPIGNDPDCDHCTDYYMIRIYDSAAFDPDTHDCTGNLLYFNGAPSYDVCNQPGDPLLDGYYVRAGNVQMHTDNNGGSVGNEEICYDGIDNDGDGLIDAADPDCYSTETSCNDGIDNDGDGLIDLADPDCQTCTPTAAKEHGSTCSDGFDNDCDGLIDAADPDCQ